MKDRAVETIYRSVFFYSATICNTKKGADNNANVTDRDTEFPKVTRE